MSAADRPGAAVFAERNEGIQIGEHHEDVDTKNVSNPTFHAGEHNENVQVKHEHHYHNDAAPGVDAYFRGLGVDPEDSRTKALASAGDKPIKSCWDRILATPEFEEWRGAQETCVLWVVGGPGKGKTILSLGLVDELAHTTPDDNGKAFVAYFFCRDTDGTANTAISILKGLVYGLGQEDRGLMRFLSDKFRSPEDIKGAGIDTMWGILAKMLATSTVLGAVYLAVDALDECHDEGGVSDLLDLVRKASFRRPVKWVFTSRQSPSLRRALGSGAGAYTIDLDTSREVEQGVDEYLGMAVGASQRLSGAQKQRVLGLLRADADKTFLYASLVLEDLRVAADVDVSRWILDLENNVHGESVYRRYRLMLQRVVERDERSGGTTLQDLLKAVLLANETLSPQEVAIAAGLPFEFYDPSPESGSQLRTTELVQQCGHFLRVAEGKVYLVHKSAKDYLTIGDGAVDEPFLWSSSLAEHAVIAERSLQALGPELLQTPDLSSLGSLIERALSHESLQRMEILRYVYSHWSHHVVQSRGEFSGWPLVERFLETRLLAWVEVMGYLDQIQRCIDMIHELRAATESGSGDAAASRGSKALLDDAYQFLVRYRPMIQAHPRQVYLLAKYFTPGTSPTRRNYEHIPCCLRIGNDPPADWDPCQYTLDVSGHQWGDKDVRKVTSPRYDRSGFNLEKFFFSFTSRDFRLGFSADGKTFSAGSSTLGRSTLRWNIADGSFAGSFDATEDGLAQSGDGCLFASWSEKGIGVWDAWSNKLICRLQNSGSSDRRCTVARFASDGSAMAAAFEESFLLRKTRRTLMVWDARDGSLLRGIDLGDDVVRDLSFVRDGCALALCLGGDLVLHDVRGHESRRVQLVDPEKPNGVAFSGNGTIVVVITRSAVAFYSVDPLDELARWSVPRVDLGLHQYFYDEQCWTRPKPNFGIEVAISGDAKTAALGFRDSIALFRLEDRPLYPAYHSTTRHGRIKDENFFLSKLPIIDALRFSPCGGYLACARNDDAVSIWDVRAAFRAEPRRVRVKEDVGFPDPDGGCERDSYHVPTYSPDGKVCGTKSVDHVHLWEVGTASTRLRLKGSPSLGYNYNQRCGALPWAFSPDSRFAVTAIGRTMHLVNICDWGHDKLVLPGHVAALAFSAQGTYFALATCTSPPLVILFETTSRRPLMCYQTDGDSIHAMAFSAAGTLVAGGAAPKSFFYYVWEEWQYTGPGAPGPPRCHKTRRPNSGSRMGIGHMQMMRIEFSPELFPGPSTAVSVICSFSTSEDTTNYDAHAEDINLGDAAITSRRTNLGIVRSTDYTNYLEVVARGHDREATRMKHLAHCDGVELLVAFRAGKRAGGMTANGIEIAPPAEQNRASCEGLAIRGDGRFIWVTWRGRRVLSFPVSISRTRRDPWETCLMVVHEPYNAWFVSYVL